MISPAPQIHRTVFPLRIGSRQHGRKAHSSCAQSLAPRSEARRTYSALPSSPAIVTGRFERNVRTPPRREAPGCRRPRSRLRRSQRAPGPQEQTTSSPVRTWRDRWSYRQSEELRIFLFRMCALRRALQNASGIGSSRVPNDWMYCTCLSSKPSFRTGSSRTTRRRAEWLPA